MMRGRYHWRETISISTFTTGPDKDNPMGDPVTKLTADSTRQNLQASVQSMDRRAVVEAGLDTTREWWWIRVGSEAGPITDAHRVIWSGLTLRAEAVNPGHPIPGEDLELTVTRDA